MAVTTHALTGSFDADRTHSSFQFAIRHMKVSTFRASFGDVDARLVADASGPRLEGAARVESISIRDPPEFREHVVRGAEFFDADNHPEIRFRSARVELADDGTAMVDGELTIRGVSRPITATGTYERPIEDPFGLQRAALELRAVLDRRDWGMAWQAPLPGGADVRRLGRRADGPPRARPASRSRCASSAVSGSLRAGLAQPRAAAGGRDASSAAGVELELLRRSRRAPAYDEDARPASRQPAVARLRAALADADGVLIATPEYNASLPGALKNALDWASRPFPRRTRCAGSRSRWSARARACSAPSGPRPSCARCSATIGAPGDRARAPRPVRPGGVRRRAAGSATRSSGPPSPRSSPA